MNAEVCAVLAEYIFKIKSNRTHKMRRDGLIVLIATYMCIEKVVHALIYHIYDVLLCPVPGAEAHERCEENIGVRHHIYPFKYFFLVWLEPGLKFGADIFGHTFVEIIP